MTVGIAAQAMAALGVLTGLWVALSPLFLTLQHGGGNAAVANLIAGLAVAAVAAASLAGPRGYAGLQFAAALLGVWVIISPFILDAKFSIATPDVLVQHRLRRIPHGAGAGRPGQRAPGRPLTARVRALDPPPGPAP